MSMDPQLLAQLLMGHQQPMSGAPGSQGGLVPNNGVIGPAAGAATNAMQQVARARMLQSILQNRQPQQPGAPQQPNPVPQNQPLLGAQVPQGGADNFPMGLFPGVSR